MNRQRSGDSGDIRAQRPIRTSIVAASIVLGLIILPAPLGDTSVSAASSTVVISQFQVAGGGTKPANDEFVELHNVSTSSVDLDGMRLVYRSAAGTTDRVLQIWSASTVVPAGGYYLLGNITGYDGPAPDATFGTLVNGELAAAGGGLALRLGAANSGTIIDSVGYGSATNAFVETSVTAAPDADSARARGESGCADTDDNAADFAELAPSSPRNSTTREHVCGAAPELQLRKSAEPDTYTAVDEVIAYRYRVTNSGNVRLDGPVTVDDDRVGVDCPAVASVGDGDRYLDPGEVLTCTASHTVSQADLNRGAITNTATATADGTTSAPDSVTVTAVQAPELQLRKSAEPDTYTAVDEVIAYRYRVTNSGNVRLDGPVTVDDDRVGVDCPAVASVGDGDRYLDPGEVLTCTASHTVSQADLNRGAITNTATATADGTTSAPDSVTVTAVQAPELQLRKSAEPDTYTAVDEVIAYRYRVTNSGNVRLDGPVTVDDDRVGVDCPAVASVGDGDRYLDPGEVLTCTASHTVSQADLNRGAITNTATATADGTTSAPDSVTVTAVQAPGLACEWGSLTFSVPPGRNAFPMRHVSVTAKGRLTEGCTFAFSLASYRTQGPTWPTSGRQVFLDHDGAVLDNDNPSIELTVRKAQCYGQTDFYAGLRVFDGNDGPLPRYPDSRTPDSNISWSTGGHACETNPPRVTPPTARFVTGRRVLLDGRVPVKSKWTATDAVSGVVSGIGQRRTPAGPWQKVTKWHGSAPTKTSWLAPADGPFRQRARATDRAGNTSTWAFGPWFSLRTLQGDRAGGIVWSGAWERVEGGEFSGGRAWRTSARGARVSARLNATDVALVASKGPQGGRIRVIVDGAKGPIIDLYSPVVRHRLVVWSSHLSGRRPHDLSFVVLRGTGPDAAAASVQIDAILAIGSQRLTISAPGPVPGAAVAGDAGSAPARRGGRQSLSVDRPERVPPPGADDVPDVPAQTPAGDGGPQGDSEPARGEVDEA